MSRVYEIVRKAGRIPLNELVLRSSQSPEAVTDELRMLTADGLIEVKGDIPPVAEMFTRGGDTLVMLTSKGFSANTA